MAHAETLNQDYLAGTKEIGTLNLSVLPPKQAPVTVIIPTNYRWTTGGTYGPLPYLLRDLAQQSKSEGVPFDLFIFDDTDLVNRQKIAPIITAAFEGIPHHPPLYLIGRQEREMLYEQLDQNLPPQVDRGILRFLTTHWGYGPQRVRGDTATMDSPVVLSFDDDLRLHETITARRDWLQRHDLEPIENSMVYVPRKQFEEEEIFEVVAIDHLSAYIKVLGKTPEELMQTDPSLVIATSTKNTKDQGLAQFMNDVSRPSQIITSHNGEIFRPEPNSRVGIASGRKRSVPDINAGALLDFYIATGMVTDGKLEIRAFPSGPHTTFVTARDTNPDSAVMGREMNDPRVTRIPWLLSNPTISAHFGKVEGPYRAEDGLYTRPPTSGVLMASVPSIAKHARSEQGFRPNMLNAFWSEALGDIMRDEVLSRVYDDNATQKLVYRNDSGQYVVSTEVVQRLYDLAVKKRDDIYAKLVELGGDAQINPQQRNRVITNLECLYDRLVIQCGSDFNDFYSQINAEIREQLNFFRSYLEVYYPLMEACADLRRKALYPASVFKPAHAPLS